MSANAAPIFLLLGCQAIEAFPVFTFSDNFYPTAPPSFASLTRNEELPDTFILCSSSKQARFDFRGFYAVLGEDGSQWLTIYVESVSVFESIWLQWNKGWYKAAILENVRLALWYHVCLEVDLQSSQIITAVNGKRMETIVGNNITNRPSTLQMVVGKWESFTSHVVQFQGSVTNIQMFTDSSDHNIEALSSEPCRQQGDLLAWNPEYWRVEGERWILVEETEDSVCDQGSTYIIAIPVEMGIHEAMDICQRKLNNSGIPHQDTITAFTTYSSWYYNITAQWVKA